MAQKRWAVRCIRHEEYSGTVIVDAPSEEAALEKVNKTFEDGWDAVFGEEDDGDYEECYSEAVSAKELAV